MFKRANKITALVVAAASIMSVVPAMAADKLGTKDGTVTEGVAFDNGNYAYYGYRTDDDDTGIWYNGGKGEKDKAIEDLEDYELHTNSTKYGEKYAYVTEEGNSDEYLVDLSNGKIADEDTPEDQEASAKAKLTSALKKAERYNNTSDSDYQIDADDVDTQRLFKNQFGELWYQYVTTATNASLSDADGAVVTTGAGAYFGDTVFTGFTNTSGKYIDASFLANLKIYNARKDKATVVEKFNKIYKDEALKVDLKGLKALAQDKDYIYALATVDVIYYPVVNGTFDFSGTGTTVVPQYFIQKISKERDSSKEDGAYVPKSVESWQLDDGTIFETDDDNDIAFEAINGDIDGQVGESKYAVKDGVLYVTLMEDSDTVHVYKLKLGKDKREVVSADVKSTNLTELTVDDEFGTDIDMTIVTLDEDDDSDATLGFDSVSIDVDGNTWVIDDGEISMFDGDEFKVQYKTDRSFDRLDVYNKDSLIAWEDGEDAYTTVQEGKDQTVSDGDVIEPRVTTPATVGWKQETTGWTFYDVNGAKVTSKWVVDNGTWYYIKDDGIMATGWYKDNSGTWYFLKSNGAMATGWYKDGDAWYYLSGSGAMLANTTVDGYKLGASGAWIQ